MGHNDSAMKCPTCNFKRNLYDFQNICIVNRTDIPEFRRRYKLKPQFSKCEIESKETVRKRTTICDSCSKCGNKALEFYFLQLRSADEGSTVIYECTKCGFK